MIVDQLENWRHYFSRPIWEVAFDFLMTLTPDTDPGEVELDGEDVFARILSYETCGPEDAVLEAHREYVDIQSVLVGAEGIDWFPAGALDVKMPYDDGNDVEFYHRPDDAHTRINVYPGTFVVLFPDDAHMPQQVVGTGSAVVKKVVVKIRLDQVRA